MFGLVRKKRILDHIAYIDAGVDMWKDIWNDAKDENVREAVSYTLDNIQSLVLDAAKFINSK